MLKAEHVDDNRTFPPDDRPLDRLVPLVYEELRRLARRRLLRRGALSTLQATELVHEAYLRLAHQGYVEWQNRGHVIGLAAGMMRRILVDHARRRQAGKRGSGHQVISLDEAPEPEAPLAFDVLALESALSALAVLDTRQAKIAELRIFGGQSVDEMAGVLGLSAATVKREWRMAKAWLTREVVRGGGDAPGEPR